MLQHFTQPEQQAITTIKRTIWIGPVQIDGFMMPNGEFRQGMKSTGRAIGHGANGHKPVGRWLAQACPGANALQGSGSQGFPQQNCPGTDDSPLVIRVTGRSESLLALDTVQEYWKWEARYGRPEIQDRAWELIDAMTAVSLERSYQEVFGVNDSRNQKDRLMDYFITLDIGPYRPMFGDKFAIDFKRVTGLEINSANRGVGAIMTDFFYSRLPAEVYQNLKDLNPHDSEGRWRVHKHHELLTKVAKENECKAMVAALRAHMSQPGATCKSVNEAMDRTYPANSGRRQKSSQARFLQASLL